MGIQAAFLDQARACVELGSPFMGRLMSLLAEHWTAETALADRFAQWEGDIGSNGAALALRAASGLHALVLQRKDLHLAAAYPPNEVEDPVLLTAVIGAMRRHDQLLCRWADSAPQTNEVRRSGVLIAVAHWLDATFQLPLQLTELGASAGLNLNFDKFAMQIGEHRWGPPEAAVRLDPEWRGQLPPLSEPRIVERRGVDLNPLNVERPDDRLRLMSYIWPDQSDRIARTRAALSLPAAEVGRADAIDWLPSRLATPWPGSLHLIYHTLAWQYFPPDRRARGQAMIEAAGAVATQDAPLAWLSMEADDAGGSAALTIRIWPGNIKLSLGRAGFHGQWVDWASP
jgi:hypothetical protein